MDFCSYTPSALYFRFTGVAKSLSVLHISQIQTLKQSDNIIYTKVCRYPDFFVVGVTAVIIA